MGGILPVLDEMNLPVHGSGNDKLKIFNTILSKINKKLPLSV